MTPERPRTPLLRIQEPPERDSDPAIARLARRLPCVGGRGLRLPAPRVVLPGLALDAPLRFAASDSAPRRNERPRPTARRSPAPRRATRRRRPPTRRRRGRRLSAARGPSRPRPLAPPKPAIRPSAPRPGPTSSRRWCRQPARQQGPLRRVQLTPVHVHRHHPRRHVRPALQLANLRRDTGGRTRSDPVPERPGSARFRTTRPHGSVLPSGSGDRPSPGRPCQGSSFVERPGSLGRDHNQRAVSRARLRRPRDVLRGRKRPPVTGDPPTTSTGRASPDDPWPAGSPANTSGSSFVERLGLPGRDHDQRAVSRARLRRPCDVSRGRKRPAITGDPPATSTGRVPPDDPARRVRDPQGSDGGNPNGGAT